MSKELRVDAVCTECAHIYIVENFDPETNYVCAKCDDAPTETYLVRIEEGTTQYLGEISTMAKNYKATMAWRDKKAKKKAASLKPREESDILYDKMRKLEKKG